MRRRYARKNRDSHRQRGVAIIEFTIVLPVMLFLILVVAEFGRAFMYYNTLTRAVRDSARYVSANAIKGQSQVVEIDAELREAAQKLVDYGNVTGSGARVFSDGTTGTVTVIDQGDGSISVTASYPYTPMLGSILPTFRSGEGVSTVFTMQAQVTMQAI